ncbi:glycosyltransferase family A protein [Gemmata sp. JC717]|uniref:glycosyltransferase family 2 protein n=1 Tax=Gemmata algarum TaxID=2975278 RepID=UPI0021BAC8DD|nr:glycosyltransferase family A protein [Gemmata algarum]MDY3555446.1 glycosyltransferase family A protein [Gemmata algarum]
MLSDDSPERRSACLVVPGGLIRQHPAQRELTRAGWDVDVLAADALGDLPREAQVREHHGNGPAELSDRVRYWLEARHRERRYGLIAFVGQGGLGFRSVQAKRAGLAFGDVPIAVILDGNSQRDREAGQRWPSGFVDVETDYIERYQFENADEQHTPDAELVEFVKRNHWAMRNGATNTSPLPAPGSGTSQEAAPLVTLAIAHYNLGTYFPDTLATLAAQTYPNLEVIAIDDGSTDAASIETFEAMRAKYPRFTFLRQPNAGIGVTRNRCLELARGEFFIPVDADNLATPEMVATFVRAMQRNPELAAMSSYFLAFDVPAPDFVPEQFLYALRPTGGPHALASIRNVYGDANAIFRTPALRAVDGYETDRGTSCEDWEAFVKLVHAGHRLGVVPAHLFYYRHRPGGFSRSTNWFANHQRVLRQFAHAGNLPPADALAAWTTLLGFYQELERREQAVPPRRYRAADWVRSLLRKPFEWLKRS